MNGSNHPQSDARLSESAARHILERAADLQRETQRRTESADALVARDAPATGYALEDLRRAAAEVGIDAAFVDAAVADTRMGTTGNTPKQNRAINRLLGVSTLALESRRLIAAPRETVLEAIHEVFTSETCKLTLQDQVGGHPLDGGELLFRSGYDNATEIGRAITWAEIKAIYVGLSPDGDETEVRVRAPLDRTRRLNYWATLGGSGLAAAGAGAAATIGTVAAGLFMPIVAVAGLAGLAGGWVVTLRTVRKMYGFSLRKGHDGLEALLRQLALSIETRSTKREISG